MTWPLQLPARFVCTLRGHLPMLAKGKWFCFRCLRDLGDVVLLLKP
jgi:hypothetical protein